MRAIQNIKMISSFLVVLLVLGFVETSPVFGQGQGAQPATATANPGHPSASGTGQSPQHGGLNATASSSSGFANAQASTNGATGRSGAIGTDGEGTAKTSTETPPKSGQGVNKTKAKKPAGSFGRAEGSYGNGKTSGESMGSGRATATDMDSGHFVYVESEKGEDVKSEVHTTPQGTTIRHSTSQTADPTNTSRITLTVSQSGNPPFCNWITISITAAGGEPRTIRMHANGDDPASEIIYRGLLATVPANSTVTPPDANGRIIIIIKASPVDITITGANAGTAAGSGITDIDAD